MTTTKTNTTRKTPTRKTCTRCEEAKPLDSFGRYAPSKDGHASYCRSCGSEFSKAQAEWHRALDELGVAKPDRRLLALALRAGLTKPIAAAKSGAKSTAKAAARKAAPKAAARKAPASA